MIDSITKKVIVEVDIFDLEKIGVGDYVSVDYKTPYGPPITKYGIIRKINEAEAEVLLDLSVSDIVNANASDIKEITLIHRARDTYSFENGDDINDQFQ